VNPKKRSIFAPEESDNVDRETRQLHRTEEHR